MTRSRDIASTVTARQQEHIPSSLRQNLAPATFQLRARFNSGTSLSARTACSMPCATIPHECCGHLREGRVQADRRSPSSSRRTTIHPGFALPRPLPDPTAAARHRNSRTDPPGANARRPAAAPQAAQPRRHVHGHEKDREHLTRILTARDPRMRPRQERTPQSDPDHHMRGTRS